MPGYTNLSNFQASGEDRSRRTNVQCAARSYVDRPADRIFAFALALTRANRVRKTLPENDGRDGLVNAITRSYRPRISIRCGGERRPWE
ncbi:MAG: hypothetical protein C4527_04755 [Candidatus Omnitrophota bacterium]|nr:MAG: hypothetical protein C4527_04755 [Candidatus Omnitrophota bacterium]